jgi:GTP-binding protein HflX
MARPPRARPEGAEHERAVVVKAISRAERKTADPFAEVIALAHTAGVQVVQAIPQRLERPHAATYLGEGKLREAAQAAHELDVDALIADNDLTPAQERNLEKASERKVVDRSQLIMDIFARRARTRQAKLQVELAQLRYGLPRLKRMWAHLSRYEGGIGMRGPGETQLETDKRLIKRKIQRLERELAGIQKRNESSLANRGNDFVVSLVGYTNAGKSTLLNQLTGARELVEDKLFATLEGRTRRWRIAPHRVVLVSDTVGFIRNLPHHLVASFQATLAEIRYADLLFHVVDSSSPDAEGQISTVEKVLKELGCERKPVWVLLNKWDRVEPSRRIEASLLRAHFADEVPVFEVSAATGEGLDEVERALDRALDQKNVRLSVLVPHRRGDLVAFLREHGKVESQEYTDEGVRMEVDLSPARAAKFRGIAPEAVLGAAPGAGEIEEPQGP